MTTTEVKAKLNYKMVKSNKNKGWRMLVETLSALMMNTSNTSLDDYRHIIANQPKIKIEKNTKYDFLLSSTEKEHLNTMSQDLLERMSLFKDYNEKVFKNNFERWEIEEANDLLFLVKYTIDENSEMVILWEKEAKYYKKYPSISDKSWQLSKIHKEIADFTKQYLQRSKEADKASKFMDTFLVENQKVLEALA